MKGCNLNLKEGNNSEESFEEHFYFYNELYMSRFFPLDKILLFTEISQAGTGFL